MVGSDFTGVSASRRYRHYRIDQILDNKKKINKKSISGEKRRNEGGNATGSSIHHHRGDDVGDDDEDLNKGRGGYNIRNHSHNNDDDANNEDGDYDGYGGVYGYENDYDVHDNDDGLIINDDDSFQPAVSKVTAVHMVLLCLDQLRALKRKFPSNDAMASNLHLDGDYLSLAIFALRRSFVAPDLKRCNDPCNPNEDDYDVDDDDDDDEHQQNARFGDSSTVLPSLRVLEEEALLLTPNDDDDYLTVNDDDTMTRMTAQRMMDKDYFDDSHPSNQYRYYHLNGLASGQKDPEPGKGGPIPLMEITMAGLAALGARTRHDAEQDMVASPLFKQFVAAVEEKGFFQDDNNMGPEHEGNGKPKDTYEQRYRKVITKFRSKLAVKAEQALNDAKHEQQLLQYTSTKSSNRDQSNNGGASVGGGSAIITASSFVSKQLNNQQEREPDAIEESKVQPPPQAQDQLPYHQQRPHHSNQQPHGQQQQHNNHNARAPLQDPNPEDLQEAENLKNKGNQHMQVKEYKKAIDSYTAALRILPNGPTSHVYFCNRAAAHLSLKAHRAAIEDCERSLRLAPDYSKAHSRLGLAHFLVEDYALAVEDYTQALQYEDNESSRNYLERALNKLHKQKKKSRHHQSSSMSTPVTPASQESSSKQVQQHHLTSPQRSSSSSQRKTSNSHSQQQRGASSSADKHNDDNKTSNNNTNQSHIQREADRLKTEGNDQMQHKKYDAAYQCYTEAIRLCPDGPSSHVYFSNRAAAACFLERYADAERDSERSLRLVPNYGKAYSRLGLSRFFLEDYTGSVEAYTRALELDPNNAASRSYLAKALSKAEKASASGAATALTATTPHQPLSQRGTPSSSSSSSRRRRP